MLWKRLIVKAPDFFMSLIRFTWNHDGSWANSVRCDLIWLCEHNLYTSNYTWSLEQWVSHIKDDPKGFAKGVSAFCSSAFANLCAYAVPAAKKSKQCETLVLDPCEICGKTFATRQKMALRRFKAHGLKDKIRLYTSTTHCVICLKEFWSRERLLDHLKVRAAGCRARLLMRDPVLSATEAQAVDDELKSSFVSLRKKGKRRLNVEKWCVRLSGPLLAKISQTDTAGVGAHRHVAHNYTS